MNIPHLLPVIRIGNVVLVGVVVLGILGPSSLAEELPQAEFINEPNLTTNEGHISLEWSGDGDLLVYELQGARKPEFLDPMKLYKGGDTTSFLSGLADGQHFFRVRARTSGSGAWGPWSQTVELVCEHHSMTLAWSLFASGGALFLLIVLFVGINARYLDRIARSDA
jgi:hypothetical protein